LRPPVVRLAQPSPDALSKPGTACVGPDCLVVVGRRSDDADVLLTDPKAGPAVVEDVAREDDRKSVAIQEDPKRLSTRARRRSAEPPGSRDRVREEIVDARGAQILLRNDGKPGETRSGGHM
jgi:hypothetical protein